MRKIIGESFFAGIDKNDESFDDHRAVYLAIIRGDGWDKIQQMPELNRWPES